MIAWHKKETALSQSCLHFCNSRISFLSKSANKKSSTASFSPSIGQWLWVEPDFSFGILENETLLTTSSGARSTEPWQVCKHSPGRAFLQVACASLNFCNFLQKVSSGWLARNGKTVAVDEAASWNRFWTKKNWAKSSERSDNLNSGATIGLLPKRCGPKWLESN